MHINHTLQTVNLIEYTIVLIGKGVELKGNYSELTLEYLTIGYSELKKAVKWGF